MARLGVATHFRRDDGWVRWTLPLALAFVLAIGAVALADSTSIDNDLTTVGNQNSVDLTAAPGAIVNTGTWIKVSWSGSNHLAAGSNIVFELREADLPLGATVGDALGTVPDPWTSTAGTDGNFLVGPSSISFTAPLVPGDYEYTVKYQAKTWTCASGNCIGGGTNPTVGGDFTINLTVEADDYHFTGFYEPVGGNSNDDDFFVTAKAGQGIALKWNLYEFEDGPEIVDPAGYSASSTRISCTLTGTGDDLPVADDAGTSGFRYSESDGQNIFVWKTLKNWTNTCRTFVLSYNDGSGPVEVAWLDVHFTK